MAKKYHEDMGGYFYVRDHWLRYVARRGDLTTAEKLIAQYIILTSNPSKKFMRSQVRIANDLGLGQGTVKNATAKLKKMRLISAKRQKTTAGNFINCYEFLMNSDIEKLMSKSLPNDLQKVTPE